MRPSDKKFGDPLIYNINEKYSTEDIKNKPQKFLVAMTTSRPKSKKHEWAKLDKPIKNIKETISYLALKYTTLVGTIPQPLMNSTCCSISTSQSNLWMTSSTSGSSSRTNGPGDGRNT